MFIEFITNYGEAIASIILTAITGWLAIIIKNICKKYIDDKTKQDVVKTSVQAIEQIYKDLNGEEKLKKALIKASTILKSKNINITDVELKALIESAVGEFNNVFYKEN